ncbi:hypothetical protein EVAR_12445_1 [Eumeta japonica]|uniref:Uncharacterized protein n=1 Tax=Eumeta variegata TaxID=151549 RepID=A0A4C1TZ99_EUMVA|nr:hypothetical protein EVAR_12445_1 [Eumeta japonica]
MLHALSRSSFFLTHVKECKSKGGRRRSPFRLRVPLAARSSRLILHRCYFRTSSHIHPFLALSIRVTPHIRPERSIDSKEMGCEKRIDRKTQE